MGYYTRHELEFTDHSDIDHIAEIEFLSGYSCLFEDEVKWYSHEKNMRKHSAKHPDILFTLKGEGEESGDMWIEYYKGGKMQQCKAKITFDDFDESKLE